MPPTDPAADPLALDLAVCHAIAAATREESSP